MGTLLFVHVLVRLGHTSLSLLSKFLYDKECPQRPSVTKTLQKYYNLRKFKKMLEKNILIVYDLYVLKEKCIKNKKKAQDITKIKSCMIGKE